MNRWYVALLGIVALIAATAGAIDTLDSEATASLNAWQKLESSYKERIALLEPYLQIANSKFGKSEELLVLTSCFKAAQGVSVANPLDSGEMAAFNEMQESLTNALAKLVVSEDIYSRLMADHTFRGLHNRLDETEGRISRSVEEYNRSLNEQNISRQRLIHRVTATIILRKDNSATVRQKDKVAVVTSRAETGANDPRITPAFQAVASN